jgi:hypothetical protein
MSYSTGGPAFPIVDSAKMQGLTIRDYVATRAMAALLANEEVSREYMVTRLADDAYLMADLMLAARKQKGK